MDVYANLMEQNIALKQEFPIQFGVSGLPLRHDGSKHMNQFGDGRSSTGNIPTV